MILVTILLATLIVSLGSFLGLFTLSINHKKLEKFIFFAISLSTGALLGGALMHLLPEAAEYLDPTQVYTTVLIAIVTFFLIEKLLHWHHCHNGECEVHTFAHMSLLGDAIHNFIDGLIIASTFMIDFHLGVVSTLAIALHEIPQEIGDFGVLLHAGYSRKKALLANFSVALMAMLGGFVGYFLNDTFQNFISYIIPFTAGGFIYIAVSDLMPEVREESNLKKSLMSFLIILLGILLVKSIGGIE